MLQGERQWGCRPAEVSSQRWQLASQHSQESQPATLPPDRAGLGKAGGGKSVGNEAVSVLLLAKQRIRERS